MARFALESQNGGCNARGCGCCVRQGNQGPCSGLRLHNIHTHVPRACQPMGCRRQRASVRIDERRGASCEFRRQGANRAARQLPKRPQGAPEPLRSPRLAAAPKPLGLSHLNAIQHPPNVSRAYNGMGPRLLFTTHSARQAASVELFIVAHPCRKQGCPDSGQLARPRPLSAPEHASGHPEPRSVSAHQPAGGAPYRACCRHSYKAAGYFPVKFHHRLLATHQVSIGYKAAFMTLATISYVCPLAMVMNRPMNVIITL